MHARPPSVRPGGLVTDTRVQLYGYGVLPRERPHFTVLVHHRLPWAYLWCPKGSVGSCWPGINVVKSWLYGVDLLLIGPELRRSLERSVD